MLVGAQKPTGSLLVRALGAPGPWSVEVVADGRRIGPVHAQDDAVQIGLAAG